MASPAIKSDGLKELWSRLRFVLLAIIIYRIGTHIPVPGIVTPEPKDNPKV